MCAVETLSDIQVTLVAAERAFLKRFLIGTFSISFSLQLAAPHEQEHKL